MFIIMLRFSMFIYTLSTKRLRVDYSAANEHESSTSYSLSISTTRKRNPKPLETPHQFRNEVFQHSILLRQTNNESFSPHSLSTKQQRKRNPRR
ncbi:hypothetical protein KC19_11G112100 [Ceratodon purpureus]|uniref:Secreted protein n=1 Tax=Ceratodon purpureus TaxID=3225 RepID=A0A8T0GDX3_CERPU|nr:hypothetical protein KC19_11G112100 [Ceratodon purpureus]